MKKQELIYTHQLLYQVRENMAAHGIQVDTEEYEDLGVNPQGIHQSKGEQEEAVQTLASLLAESIEAESGAEAKDASDADPEAEAEAITA